MTAVLHALACLVFLASPGHGHSHRPHQDHRDGAVIVRCRVGVGCSTDRITGPGGWHHG